MLGICWFNVEPLISASVSDCCGSHVVLEDIHLPACSVVEDSNHEQDEPCSEESCPRCEAHSCMAHWADLNEIAAPSFGQPAADRLPAFDLKLHTGKLLDIFRPPQT
ncbi:MAG: hypothetical protein H6510_14560 [Acidobacteria bacterium]|nr:hypothetical protein [Acidobacteriota bacterium]